MSRLFSQVNAHHMLGPGDYLPEDPYDPVEANRHDPDQPSGVETVRSSFHLAWAGDMGDRVEVEATLDFHNDGGSDWEKDTELLSCYLIRGDIKIDITRIMDCKTCIDALTEEYKEDLRAARQANAGITR